MAFKVADILVSRTDKRGVIQAANKAFQHVSGYPWGTLHNAPHKIIRHPDMPKSVFWLFWKMLQNGDPVGAFVKNKSADGSHYWVFAIATPLDDGYMSVRLKPQGELFENVVNLYEKRLVAEQNDGCTPEASANALLADIQALGFRDYKAFMSKAIIEQITLRDHALNRPAHGLVTHMTNAIQVWSSTADEMHNTTDAFANVERLPMNMRIQASNLSDVGNPLSVIAGNFTTLNDQIRVLMSEFLKSGAVLETTLLEGLFLTCVSQVQSEAVEIFQNDNANVDGIDNKAEAALMQAQTARYNAKAEKGLKAIVRQIEVFEGLFDTIKTLHSGIFVTRVMAEIEVGRISGQQTSSLSTIVQELANFLETEGIRLKRLVDGVRHLRREAECALGAINKNNNLLKRPCTDKNASRMSSG